MGGFSLSECWVYRAASKREISLRWGCSTKIYFSGCLDWWRGWKKCPRFRTHSWYRSASWESPASSRTWWSCLSRCFRPGPWGSSCTILERSSPIRWCQSKLSRHGLWQRIQTWAWPCPFHWIIWGLSSACSWPRPIRRRSWWAPALWGCRPRPQLSGWTLESDIWSSLPKDGRETIS